MRPARPSRRAPRGRPVGRALARHLASVLAVGSLLAGCTGHADPWDLESPEDALPDWSTESIPDQEPLEPPAEPSEPERVLVRDEPSPAAGADLQSRPEPEDEDLRSACERGQQSAREDAERGHMTVDAWGYPASCAFQYWALLAERYGVHTAHHGCVVTEEAPEVKAYRRCYRAEVDVIVKAKHGEDAYEKVWIEAHNICESRSR